MHQLLKAVLILGLLFNQNLVFAGDAGKDAGGGGGGGCSGEHEGGGGSAQGASDPQNMTGAQRAAADPVTNAYNNCVTSMCPGNDPVCKAQCIREPNGNSWEYQAKSNGPTEEVTVNEVGGQQQTLGIVP